MSGTNYYDILEVSPTATEVEIKDAYRLIASMLHPDKFSADSKQQQRANAKLQQVNEAYSVLKDPLKRKQYDSASAQKEKRSQENTKCPPKPEQRASQEQRRQTTSSRQAFRAENNTQENNYHRPYCNRCRTYVMPQVVSATYVSGGPQYVGSNVTYRKFCSICGEQVWSQEEVDRERLQRENSARTVKRFLLSIFVGIPALIVVVWISAALIAVVAGGTYMGIDRVSHMNGADRRIALFQFYEFGGAALGLFIYIQYIVCLARRLPRLPWSAFLSAGWLFLLAGFILLWQNAKPGHMESPALTLAADCLYISPGLYWLATIPFWSTRKRRNAEI